MGVGESLKWSTRDCEIRDATGQVLFQMKNVEAPEQWSDLAVEIAASKYFFKGGDKGSSRPPETSVRQMVDRVVQHIVAAGVQQKHFRKGSQAQNFASKLTDILLRQKAFFNSPVWFNCGVKKAYGAISGSKNWTWSASQRKVVLQKDALVSPQVSACFIQSVEDSLESIFDLAKAEALLFKFGSGSGTNFTNLRSKTEHLARGGQSSGVLAFLRVLDRGAGAIKSGGTTRRAAKMVCLDIDHPEIQEFIVWKMNEEKKAQALIQAGYSADYEGEAYQTVAGQNANNSVRISDTFLKALATHQPWSLRSRSQNGKQGSVLKKISAQELWDQLNLAAWTCADPGLQFADTINAWHTCPKSGPIRASNPCSEYLFLDDSACNLASLNLLAFCTPEGFATADFIATAEIIFQAQEILVDSAGYPTEKIARNSHDFRPLGLGLSGLGAFLMSTGIPYDSDSARHWAGGLAALLTGVAYRKSAEMAKQHGAFAGYKPNRQAMLKVLRRHQKAARTIVSEDLPLRLRQEIQEQWQLALQLGARFGFRNAQATVMAPTGTIGLVLDADTTGIEPEFSLVKIKKMAGGGSRRLVSQSLRRGLLALGYADEVCQRIQAHAELFGEVSQSVDLRPEHRVVFAGAMEISAEGHLQMMAAMQPFVSGGISKTVNLPQSATVEDIARLHLQAQRLGLKSIAIYRNLSKSSQPLNSSSGDPKKPWIDDGRWPKCSECGAPTELAGGCFRCVNCGSVIGCA